MAVWILIGLLSFLFLLEGTVFQVLVPQAWGSRFVWIPQLVVSGIILLSLYRGRQAGLLFGFCFGLLHDIVYGQAVGVYAFSTAAIGYVAGQISRQFLSGPIVALLATGVGQWLHLLISYFWFRLFDLTRIGLEEAFLYHMLPSVLLNMMIAFPVYQCIRWIHRRYHPRSVQLFD
ncbi:rod shape-determining protein MreD [Desmospora profundinema]|uniref:Rod shape-determining protein MreD n=1 Tax=Desmospora profundinema TaxID=1571184 RepID=A0ABU1INR1_9BACL|nr:rod shape-determining protein MreD [Desmospora profundinema]MDR6226422.1 rod shape-determining protein MreD [Desmospora profundinema]